MSKQERVQKAMKEYERAIKARAIGAITTLPIMMIAFMMVM